jgi:5,6-dimethylbenzimidazole synthase
MPPKLTGVTEHSFSASERQAVYRAIAERRDMRRFVPDAVVPEEVLARLMHAAHSAKSVGLMQPWRFIRITDSSLRARIHAIVDDERLRTAEALGARGEQFLSLKVEGILECAELLVVARLGPVPDFPHRPQLEIDEWTLGRPLSEFVSENGWTPDMSPIGWSS